MVKDKCLWQNNLSLGEPSYSYPKGMAFYTNKEVYLHPIWISSSIHSQLMKASERFI